MRMLFVDHSSAFNAIVPATHVVKQDPGLPNRQTSGAHNGQQQFIPAGSQHWCSSGLCPQPTAVCSVQTTVIVLVTRP